MILAFVFTIIKYALKGIITLIIIVGRILMLFIGIFPKLKKEGGKNETKN